MKISTSFLFDRATERMSTIQNQLAATQAQMAVSKKILAPSDSPDQAAAIQRLKGEIERQGSQQRSMNVALRRYTAEESALKSSVDLLTRMKELGIKAANDTLGPADRKAIAVEMRSIRDQLLSTGNSQDDNGNYIFSATRVNTPAFAEDDNGNVIYQGDQTQTSIPAGVERSVNFTRSGTDIFSRVIRTDTAGNEQSVGFFKAIDEMVAAVEASNTSGIQQGIGDTSQMFNSVTFALAQTGSDQVVVQSQIDMLDETALRLKSTLSDVEDLDYAEAATRMNKEMMALEAAMSSFAKISGMNLFDYIRS